jgi:hypothetical protein
MMKINDRNLFLALLVYSFFSLSAVFAMATLYLFLAQVEMVPIYWFMLALSVVILGGIGAAGLIVARGLPPESGHAFRLRFTPARLGHAGFATLLMAGTGSVTAAGLGQPGWFIGAVALSALYAGVVFAARGDEDTVR